MDLISKINTYAYAARHAAEKYRCEYIAIECDDDDDDVFNAFTSNLKGFEVIRVSDVLYVCAPGLFAGGCVITSDPLLVEKICYPGGVEIHLLECTANYRKYVGFAF